MGKKLISILDYEIGNQQSVMNSINSLGYSGRVTKDINELEESDLIILPGVGTFCKAMKSLEKYKLNNFLKDYALNKRPLIGICLGMQLLADFSNEIVKTEGLGIIPGCVDSIKNPKWHIGWNNIDVEENSCLKKFDKYELYFNHSFTYKCAQEFIQATCSVGNENKNIVACVKKYKTIGLQFHPEKSQIIGSLLLESLLNQLI